MSAGKFTRAFYKTNNGDTVPIRVQPETLQATIGGTINGTAAAPATRGFPSATVSGSRRSIGIHPRTVTVEITAGAPAGYLAGQTYTIPILNETAWNNAAPGVAVGYLGGTGEVVSSNPEKIK